MIPEQVSQKGREPILSVHRRLVQIIAILILVLPTVAAADVVQGRFTHRIPINIPPGTNGMQPNLALTYDSGRGNGDAGMGWALEGLSYITRCNYGNGINYDGNDSYCHSDLGVLVKMGDNTYRSKKESFTRFWAIDKCGDGPCSWVAYDRSGVRLYYGNTSDSRLYKMSSASVRTWHIAQVVDLFGNSYNVSYLNNPFSQGRSYPIQINYTMGNGQTTFRAVQLQYETRDDVDANYAQSDYTATIWRLNSIIVKSGCTR